MKTTSPNINEILAAERRLAKPPPITGRENRTNNRYDRVYLQRVKLTHAGLAPDGTFWNTPFAPKGMPLWCAFTLDDETRIFMRAETVRDARAMLCETHPQVWHRLAEKY